MSDVLGLFLPAVRRWFAAEYGLPTRPQELGWPAIQRGDHVLVFSPTGSGKTMAAFLWGINAACVALSERPTLQGVQLLYISPLKALNNDIERNLRAPLAGIRAAAHDLGQELPPIRVAVRTGDTPASARQRMTRQPPHILITTPESLYLLLTSDKSRAMFATVKAVIVDEIHTLCGSKRGVHLGLSLERLQALTERPFQRIGLSATQRPLDEVARFLGGQEWERDEGGSEQLTPRPVTIVDAGQRKALDLRVVTAVGDFRRLPGGSIWPAVVPRVLDDIRRRRTTLVFVNGRRAAERTADRLNEQYALEEDEEIQPGSTEGLLADGVPKGQGLFGTGRVGGPFRAHHGSVSKEVRLELEQQLKAGRLPALVATSSLELGIDIGSVDLVVQLQSPKSIARGLQRVGRSGHMVGQTSVGRIYATHREDLLDAAAVARGMLRGDIEPTYTPRNCLDVLAQQIVAMVAVQDWPVAGLHSLVRQAYGYQSLTRAALDSVLCVLSGQFAGEPYHELRPRLSWDRVQDVLHALPGSRLLALSNGGTIPDRGNFNVYLPDRKTLLGTLDEEFVYETRVGDIFSLGSGTWKAIDIDNDKVVVADAAGALPRMPFWHGDAPKREYHTGVQLGCLRRELSERVRELPPLPNDAEQEWPSETAPVIAWLANEYAMDEPSARNAILYVRQQLDALGAISSDRTVIAEAFTDALGDQRLVIHSCFGGRVNSAWALALANALREQFPGDLETQVNDDGILFRFPRAEREAPIGVVRALGPEEARERLLAELPNSALFGAQFRMNAGRALLLPGLSGRRRTPFWLQRLRAKDLLAATRNIPDFPIIAETYRDCLREVLDMEAMTEVLGQIQGGTIRVVEAETAVPSPVAASLLYEYMAVGMYEGDLPKAERQMQALAIHRELLTQLLEEGVLPELLTPQALAEVGGELQHVAEGYRARSAEELATISIELGDLTEDEMVARCVGDGRAWLLRLAAERRIVELPFPSPGGPQTRWVAAEHVPRYGDAFHLPSPEIPAVEEPRHDVDGALAAILRVYARTHGPFTFAELVERYPHSSTALTETLGRLVVDGYVVTGRLSPGATHQEWCERHVLERIHRRTLALLRKQVQPVSTTDYAGFLLRWQGLHLAHQRRGLDGLAAVLRQLGGFAAPVALWERDLLRLRVSDLRVSYLDTLTSAGDLVWVLTGSGDPRRARLRFVPRGEGACYLETEATIPATVTDTARAVAELLHQQGACYSADLRRSLHVASHDLDNALAELAQLGLITNDHYTAVHGILQVDSTPTVGPRSATSALQAELDAWRAGRSPSLLRHPPTERMRQAKREAAQRVPAPMRAVGRWSLVHGPGIWGQDMSRDERCQYLARHLLERYGVVSRECLEHEETAYTWGELFAHLQRMELRGAARRGYFVRGLSGVQFALPEAIERLRAWVTEEAASTADEDEELVLVNACDPANLYGVTFSGPDVEADDGTTATPLARETDLVRVGRLPSNYLVMRHGLPIIAYEHGGGRWSSLAHVGDGAARAAVQLLVSHLTRDGGLCSRPRRVLVTEWNGASPVGGPAQSLLESLGFRRETPSMVWDGG